MVNLNTPRHWADTMLNAMAGLLWIAGLPLYITVVNPAMFFIVGMLLLVVVSVAAALHLSGADKAANATYVLGALTIIIVIDPLAAILIAAIWAGVHLLLQWRLPIWQLFAISGLMWLALLAIWL